MPTMDAACFYGNDKSNVNIMSYNIIDRRELKRLKEIITPVVKNQWKLTSHIQEILGDYYWAPTEINESLEYIMQELPKDMEG
jgi:hypothetical protein